MSDIRVTGGYEPNDPVVMSREEYRAALAQARREGVEAMVPYVTHQSKCELRRSGDYCTCGLARLEAEVRENMELRKRVPDVVVTWGTGEKTGINDPMRKRAESAERRVEALEAENRRLREAAAELLAVADLRGDTDLPHPANDPKLWSARMADAWASLREALAPQGEPQTVEYRDGTVETTEGTVLRQGEQQECPSCSGTGVTEHGVCRTCEGIGLVPRAGE